MPNGARLDIAVDERREAVHQQDREHDAFRHVGVEAQHESDHAATDGEDHLTPAGHGIGHVVGGHETGSQQQASGQRVEHRVAALDPGQQHHSADEADRDAPVDQPLDEQDRQPEEYQHRRDLADAAPGVAEKKGLHVPCRVYRELALADQSYREERCGARDRVDRLYRSRVDHARLGVDEIGGGHVTGPRDEKDRASHQGGIEYVVAQPAEYLLAQRDGYDPSDEGYPERQAGREGEREEEAGHDSGEIRDGHR